MFIFKMFTNGFPFKILFTRRNDKLYFTVRYYGIFAIILITFVNYVSSNNNNKLSDIEIKALSGEPNYKSVHLSWDIEETSTSSSSPSAPLNQNPGDETPEIPKFTIYYCELQSFGPHRCRSKLVEDNAITDYDDSIKHYSTTINNLRMATKYSFHIKPQSKKKTQKISGRSDNRDNEIEPESMFSGQTIIIPTKGFSAEATKCLPHASEIEVETGPYFGGKIVVDGGKCGIQGDIKSPIDKYVMRIDHERCGSLVKPETNTVETFITVQENVGIFTHSTRRFVVVCTFQSGMQTVRASFTVPGKNGVASLANTDEDLSSLHDSERNGRERQFRMVDKSALVLKENYNDNNNSKNENDKQIKNINETKIRISINDELNTEAEIEHIIPNINENDIKGKNLKIDNLFNEYDILHDINNKNAKYARLVVDNDHEYNTKNEEGNSTNSSYTGLVIAVSLSVIMIGVFIYILQRELRRQKTENQPKRLMIRNPSV